MVFFNMYRNQVIGNEFHPTAIAERAEISALLSKVGEQIHALCNGIAVAAGIDHKIAILCLRAGSAQRTVQRYVAGVLQDRFEAKLVSDGESREFDHNPPRLTGIGNCLRDILDRCRPGKAGHDDWRVACDLTRVTGDCDVGQRKFGSSCGVDIEADHAPSTIDEIAGDRASHDAKPTIPTVLFLRARFPAVEFD